MIDVMFVMWLCLLFSADWLVVLYDAKLIVLLYFVSLRMWFCVIRLVVYIFCWLWCVICLLWLNLGWSLVVDFGGSCLVVFG